MASVKGLLAERLKKKDKSKKMEQLATQSAQGNLTGFSGIFNVAELNEYEKSAIEEILLEYSEKEDISKDFSLLVSLTSEVKAITNQAVLLHGERIKKAQNILKSYKEGAFTAWLIATYGNRQTPYNFLQYFEFFYAMPSDLRPLIEAMPRQAIYTLASRDGEFDKKLEIVQKYQGETKAELLCRIREIFPLELNDKRKSNVFDSTLSSLRRLSSGFVKKGTELNKKQKEELKQILDDFYDLIS